MVVMVVTISRNLALCFDLCFRRKYFEWLLLPLCFWYIGDIRALVKFHEMYVDFGMKKKLVLEIFVLHMYCDYTCRISLKKYIIQIASIVCNTFVARICWKYIFRHFFILPNKTHFIIIFIHEQHFTSHGLHLSNYYLDLEP